MANSLEIELKFLQTALEDVIEAAKNEGYDKGHAEGYDEVYEAAKKENQEG